MKLVVLALSFFFVSVLAQSSGRRVSGNVIPGGHAAQDPTDPEIKKLLALDGVQAQMKTRVESCNRRSNSLWSWNVDPNPEIISATSQVVAGINYNIRFRLSPECRNRLCSSLPSPSTPNKECTVRIYVVPWLKTPPSVSGMDCNHCPA